MSEFDSNNFDSGFDAYGSAGQQFSTEPVATPALGVVALVLSIVAVFVSLIACCCIPILFGGLGLALSVVALILNIVAGNSMKAMYGQTNGFIQVTRIVEIIIVVLMVIGLGIDIVATVINVANVMNPNSAYNQLINQLTGNLTVF